MAAKLVAKSCSVSECDRPYHSKGMCELHRRRIRKFGTTELPVKRSWFDRASEKTEFRECWEFKGANVNRYGIIMEGGESWLLSRLSFEKFVEPIKPGFHVLHKCDNPPCWNPEHLFQGTNADNVADKMLKGRQARIRGEARSTSKLTDKDVLEIRELIRRGDESLRAIGRKFWVAHVQIVRIKQGKHWGHVE